MCFQLRTAPQLSREVPLAHTRCCFGQDTLPKPSPTASGIKAHKAESGLRVQQQFEPHAWLTAMESKGRPQLQPHTFISPWIVTPLTSGREQTPLLWWCWLLRLISYLKVAFPSQGLGQEVAPAEYTGCLWVLILEMSSEPPAWGSAALRAQGQLRLRVLL